MQFISQQKSEKQLSLMIYKIMNNSLTIFYINVAYACHMNQNEYNPYDLIEVKLFTVKKNADGNSDHR